MAIRKRDVLAEQTALIPPIPNAYRMQALFVIGASSMDDFEIVNLVTAFQRPSEPPGLFSTARPRF